MKHLHATKKQIAAALGLSLLLGSGLTAQVSYNANGAGIVGSANTAIGLNSQIFTTSGNYNTATGCYAIYAATSGARNTGTGAQALQNLSTGNHNAGHGFEALANTVTGSYNTANGSFALVNGDGNENTATGYKSLFFNAGMQNVANGCNSLLNHTGDACTGVGYNVLNNNTTGNNNTALGYMAEVTALGPINRATAIGQQAIVDMDDKIRLGSAGVTIIEGQVAYSWPSDGRFKTNVSEGDVKGLEFIKLLRPVVYNFDTRKFTEFITQGMPDENRAEYLKTDFKASTAIRQSGFIAQEVEKAAQKVGYDFNGVIKPVGENGHYSMAYSEFVVPLVKAVQEQQQIIERMQKKMDEQAQEINSLKQDAANGINQANPGIIGFSMSQNEPNPFTHETEVRYTLPQQINQAYMVVYDLSGKQVTTFEITQKGEASVTLTSEKLAAGIYIYSIVADGKVLDSKRMIIADK